MSYFYKLSRPFYILLILSFFSCTTTDPLFLDEFHHDFKIGQTTRAQIEEEGYVLDPSYSNDADFDMYRLDDFMYCYIYKPTDLLETLKIWKLPKIWNEAGIHVGVNLEKFLKLMKHYGVPLQTRHNKYDQNYFVYRNGLEYWFCFPRKSDDSLGESMDELDFVVVKTNPKK